MDRQHQKNLIKGSETMYQDQQLSKKHWDTMYQIAKGHLSMEQLTPQQQQFYAKLITEHEDDLLEMVHNPFVYREMMQSWDKGEVVPFTGKAKKGLNVNLGKVDVSQMDNVFPIGGGKLQGVLNKPLHQIRHPKSGMVPWVSGLAGMVLAAELTNAHQNAQKEEQA